LQQAGYQVINADLTLLCEAPRLSAHRAAIRESIATLLGVAVDAVNLKATTTEKMGFLGRREGIAAEAVVLIERR
ncbi:MAG: 2-C-methyl-D-erythritol 2,4-cyclodiphosphate synthase, partial [Gammaproteobacteria bacterium]